MPDVDVKNRHPAFFFAAELAGPSASTSGTVSGESALPLSF
jgi:hypothetical protein